jgi:phosphoglycolate phosphatase
MILQAMWDLGVEACDTVMIGDTSFDMDMATAAGVSFIGVAWGYHEVARLAGADVVIEDFAQLEGALETVWSKTDV